MATFRKPEHAKEFFEQNKKCSETLKENDSEAYLIWQANIQKDSTKYDYRKWLYKYAFSGVRWKKELKS